MTMSQRWRTTILVVALCASSVWSQEEQQTPPPSPETMKPDTRPLSGAEGISLGSLVGERSYLQPGFLVAQSADSNAQFQFGSQSGFLTATALAGRLTLEHVGKRNQFSAAYQGGGIIYENDTQLNSTFHLAAFSDSISFRRATLTLSDRGSYLPGLGLGVFGFGGGLGIGNVGNMSTLNPAFVPGRNILSGATGYQNVALAQLEYRPGPRSAVTVAGAFQTLSSTQEGFVSSNGLIFQAGYDRSLTARDTVAVYYSASFFRYSGVAENVDGHFVAFSYGRRVTGRLALQLYGGPEFFTVTVPGQSETKTLGSGGGSLTYRWPKTEAGISYWKGISAGSGVLTGAQTDSVTATLTRPLSRAWSGGLTGSYNVNSGVRTPNSQTAKQTYNYWLGTAHLTRSVGRYADLSFFYSFQNQHSNQTFSSGGGNGHSFARHLFGAAFNFDYRTKGL